MRMVDTRAIADATEIQMKEEESQNEVQLSPFHLAVPVYDLEEARAFYGSVLQCSEGRSSPGSWVDFNFFGHQLVLHRVNPPPDSDGGKKPRVHLNPVDGDAVPVPHFGVALDVSSFHALVDRIAANNAIYTSSLESDTDTDTDERRFLVKYVIKPHLRFKGKPGEQYTMFFYDPSGNALEFKAMYGVFTPCFPAQGAES